MTRLSRIWRLLGGALLLALMALPVQAADELDSLSGTWMQVGGTCSEPDYIWTRTHQGRFEYRCIPTSMGACDFDRANVDVTNHGDGTYTFHYPGGIWEKARFEGPNRVNFFASSQGYSYGIERCGGTSNEYSPPAPAGGSGDMGNLAGTWMQQGGTCSQPDYVWTPLGGNQWQYRCIPTDMGACDFDQTNVTITPERGGSFLVQYPGGIWERGRFEGPSSVMFFESSEGYRYGIERCR